VTETFADDIAAVARIDVVPKILEVICRTTGMGFAAVARVTEDRWIACAVRDEIAFGLEPGGELEVKTTICDEIRQSGEGVLIDHVAQDPRFRDHHTPRQYGLQSYVSVPIWLKGAFFGTLCAIDPNPAKVMTGQTKAMFELFADLIAQHLDVQEDLEISRAALIGEQETAELREQFIAVLGHDLRNPLASIAGGARLLRKAPLTVEAAAIVTMMQASADRMGGLIENLLDFARGRLGGGIELRRAPQPSLEESLRQVIAELGVAHPSRAISSDIDLPLPVVCDSGRIAQLASNLIANALTHGDAGSPVSVTARAEDGAFVLSVTNAGEAIPAATLGRLFQPYARSAGGPSLEGLGLGLYIVQEIAKAHGGVVTVASDAAETRFVFTMPLG
jgi:signal transduction histidine kinase